MDLKDKARELLRRFKGDSYVFGLGVLDRAADFAARLGGSVLVVANGGEWLKPTVDELVAALGERGAALAGGRRFAGARPNSPREDVYRIACVILHCRPDCILAVGGGSTIDAVKAANVLAALGSHSLRIDDYFGAGKVTEAVAGTGAKLIPTVAVQTASGSAAHLTRYSNITDPATGQKKLIVDDAIVPTRAVFDYSITCAAPAELTVDGALDGLAHTLEVFYGIGDDKLEQVGEIALTAVELILANTPRAVAEPGDLDAREALGLATDLGGYAIMTGGTNGPHLTSFSLVDLTSHGRACGIMMPYYTVFFAPAITDRLRRLARVLHRAELMDEEARELAGRDLGLAVAGAMTAFAKSVGAPTALGELDGFTDDHVARALAAAKDPQLKMKLRNMPVPLDAGLVDRYMAPILQAAKAGDFSLIENMT